MRFSLQWRWYDLWVGVFVDLPSRRLYICPLPTVVVVVDVSHRAAPTAWRRVAS
jgi:hypothetical protein